MSGPLKKFEKAGEKRLGTDIVTKKIKQVDPYGFGSPLQRPAAAAPAASIAPSQLPKIIKGLRDPYGPGSPLLRPVAAAAAAAPAPAAPAITDTKNMPKKRATRRRGRKGKGRGKAAANSSSSSSSSSTKSNRHNNNNSNSGKEGEMRDKHVVLQELLDYIDTLRAAGMHKMAAQKQKLYDNLVKTISEMDAVDMGK